MEELYVSIAVVLISIWGAFWARVDGGGIIDTPNWFERLMCALPFLGYGAVNAFADFGDNHETYWALLCILPYLLMGMDPGSYFSSRQAKLMDSEPGAIDWIVRIFFGPDPRITSISRPSIGRVRLGMFLTGLAQVLGPLIYALIIEDYFSAIMFFLAGFGRAVAYAVFYDTEDAEPANGFQRSFFAALAIFFGGIK